MLALAVKRQGSLEPRLEVAKAHPRPSLDLGKSLGESTEVGG
jgi:hypothetical protein